MFWYAPFPFMALSFIIFHVLSLKQFINRCYRYNFWREEKTKLFALPQNTVFFSNIFLFSFIIISLCLFLSHSNVNDATYAMVNCNKLWKYPNSFQDRKVYFITYTLLFVKIKVHPFAAAITTLQSTQLAQNKNNLYLFVWKHNKT